MKRLTRDDTEHGVEYYRADEVDAILAEQPAKEPITWMCKAFDGEACEQSNHDECENPIPLYTTPPKRKPLTDDQKLVCWSRATCDADVEHKTEHQCLMDYGIAIEAAHNIK